MKDRITLRLDARTKSIIIREQRESESISAAVVRLIGAASEQEKRLLELQKTHLEEHQKTRQMMAEFLKKIESPIGKIGHYLAEISENVCQK